MKEKKKNDHIIINCLNNLKPTLFSRLFDEAFQTGLRNNNLFTFD